MIVEVFIVLLTIICVLKYKSKVSYMLLCSLMFILMTFNTYNADLFAYQGRYNEADNIKHIFQTDLGFGFLSYICKISGLSFTEYIGVIFIIGISILSIILFKYSNMPSYVLWLYFLISFQTHIIQIRAFLSEIIVVGALLYYAHTTDRRWWIKYVILILIASIFHVSSILYLLVVAFAFVDNKKVILTVVVASMAIIPILNEMINKINLPMRVGILANIYTSSYNLDAGYKTFFFCIIYLFMYFCVSGITKRQEKNQNKKNKFPIIQKLNLINIMGLIFCGLIIVYNNNFYRYNRIIIMLNYIVLMNYYGDSVFKDKKKIALLMIISVFGFILGEILMKNWYPMIINNSVLSR